MRWLMLVVTVPLTGCLGLYAEKPSDSDGRVSMAQSNAIDALVDCVSPKIPQYSRGPDAAPVVARGLVNSCHVESEALRVSTYNRCRTHIRGPNDALCVQQGQGAIDAVVEQVAGVIVTERSRQAKR